jgi:hypothetical protein
MSRVKDLRAEVKKLYRLADTIKNGEERLVVVLRAIELATEADVLERESLRPIQEGLQPAQQQLQPDDDQK